MNSTKNVSFWGRQLHFKHLLAHDIFAQCVIEVAADRQDLCPPPMFDRVIDERRTDCFASQVVLSDQLEGYIKTEPTPVVMSCLFRKSYKTSLPPSMKVERSLLQKK
ncbi:MAG: hypothetical protein QF560_14455 [SAR324 cluster bacterium]|nr:hypothetical protein [SAR324 cluster bacterium]HJM08377.1 hypothetical protein [SAR324 cluster bacterium]